jgi:hypothetical protein
VKMAKSNYGYVQINSDSTATTSEFNIFNPSAYSSFSAYSASNGTNFTENAGFSGLYFTETGDYQVVCSLYTSASANTSVTVKIDHVSFGTPQGVLNSFTFNLNQSINGYQPAERTLQAMITGVLDEVNAIQVKFEDTSGNAVVMPGTSVFVTKMDSGFGSIERVSDTAEASAEYNPFDTTQAPGSTGATSVLTDGSIVSETSAGTGSLKTTTAGLGVFLYTGVQDRGGTGSRNVDSYFYVNDVNADGVDFRNWKATAEEPIEASFFAARSFTANDVLRMGNESTLTFKNNAGSAISFYQPNSDSHFNYLVTKTASDSISSGSTFTLFDEDNYTTYTTASHQSGITFDSTNGKFTISRDGDYLLMLSARPDAGGIDTPGYLAISLLKNAATIQTVDNYFSLQNDPVERTSLFLVPSASSGDTFSFSTVANGSVAEGIKDGTAVLVLEMFETDTIPPLIAEGVADPSSINSSFIVTLYNSGSLNAQYEREIEQVPFSLGIRGPLSLRGRTSSSVVVPKK